MGKPLALTLLLVMLLSQQLKYPPARMVDVVDDYHGTKVADPYRWMEDLNSPELATWIAQQNALTESYLKRLPLRAHFQQRIAQLWDFRKTNLPVVEAGRVFYRMNIGLQQQSPLYMREGLDGPATLLIDPNILWPDATTSLADFSPSPDGRLLAYTIAPGGADWQTVRVRNVSTGQDLPDEVQWMRFSYLVWTKDSDGFFYSRYPEPAKGTALSAELVGHALYYHVVGTPQSQDRRVFDYPEHPRWFVTGALTEDGRYLLISTSKGADNSNHLYVADLRHPRKPDLSARVLPLIVEDGAEYAPLGNVGSRLFMRTDRDAPNRKIVAVDLAHAHGAIPKTIVTEGQHALETASLFGGRLVVEYLEDVKSRLATFDLDGKPLADVALPGTGSLSGFTGREDSPLMFYAFTSPLYPTTVIAHDLATGRSMPFESGRPPVDAARYETRQLFATSRDGTRVPYFVTMRKDLQRDGNNPTVIYGYGGFAVTNVPGYRPDVPAWLELGGLWVTASLRGGAEYGEAWHKAGMLERKQNVFDDTIAVAEHLIKERYTRPSKLAMSGGSNGGLLVAAVMQQRPDLFAAVLPAVGVLDMLRYDRFTGGKAWVTEYGSASDPAQFAFLFKYSPLHQLKSGTCYPATLVTTADHDDRVVPSHSFKYTATLQAAQGCEKPVLIRVETGGSHNYRATDKRVAELADLWAFTAEQLAVARPR
jgi:prolyl oligopeptidase